MTLGAVVAAAVALTAGQLLVLSLLADRLDKLDLDRMQVVAGCWRRHDRPVDATNAHNGRQLMAVSRLIGRNRC
jgi:hypothetical protein